MNAVSEMKVLRCSVRKDGSLVMGVSVDVPQNPHRRGHPLAWDSVTVATRFRRGAQAEIIGKPADGATTHEQARQPAPDVVTMDIGPPDVIALEVTRKLR